MPSEQTGRIRAYARTACVVAWAIIGACAACAVPQDDPRPAPAPATDSPTSSVPAARRLNLLLITIDTLRADHLGCYGYFRDTSPTTDALARESLLFERCLVPVAQTLPSHLSLMTGVYPIEHGVQSNLEKPGGQHFASTPQLRTLAEWLQANGYRTAGFVSATPLKRDSGIAAGFDTFNQPDHARRLGAQTTDAALECLAARQPAEPFFLWLHLFDPHAPYDPPPPYDGMFAADEKLEAHLAQRQVPARVQKQRNDRRVVPEEAAWDTRKAVNGYDGEIRYVDDQVRRLLSRLDEAGLTGHTVIVLTADHGEGLGQHGIVMHDAVWFEQLHVPLMIRVPGRSPQRVPQPMRSIDVLPTLVALLAGLPGETLVRQCRGANMLADPSAAAEVFAQEPEGRSNTRTLWSGEWKLVVEGDDARLFHLPTDPFELTDISKDKTETVAHLRQRLSALVKDQESAALRYQQGRPTTAAPPDPASDRRRSELKALGYVETEEDDEEQAEKEDLKRRKPTRGSP